MVEKTLTQEWVHLGRWLQPPLSGGFWPRTHEAGSFADVLGFSLQPLLFLDGHTLIAKSDVAKLDDLAQRIHAQKDHESVFNALEEAGVRVEARCSALFKQSGRSDTEHARAVMEAYVDMVGVWTAALLFADALERVVHTEKLVTDHEDFLHKLSPYTRATWLEKQSAAISDIATSIRKDAGSAIPTTATEIQNNPRWAELIAAHLDAFAWFGSHHWEGEGYTEDKCTEDILESLASDSPHQYEVTSKTEYADNAMWNLVAGCMYWRTHAAEVTAKMVFNARAALTNVGCEWDLSYEELVLLTGRELDARIVGTLETFPENMPQRKEGYGVVLEGGNETVLVGKELTDAIGRVVPVVEHEGSEIRGTVASKGSLVSAPAKVIMSPSEFARFEEGDVLVTNETTPDFVPLMKIAGAIVTDIGGVTSHAAIVSRELKKPCIIATKVATRVLKDGDMVSVDTEDGVITILS